LVIVDVHARDIVDGFVRDSILDAREFAWESQLRFYWDRDLVRGVLTYSCADRAMLQLRPCLRAARRIACAHYAGTGSPMMYGAAGAPALLASCLSPTEFAAAAPSCTASLILSSLGLQGPPQYANSVLCMPSWTCVGRRMTSPSSSAPACSSTATSTWASMAASSSQR
jgi:hypothetical protein